MKMILRSMMLLELLLEFDIKHKSEKAIAFCDIVCIDNVMVQINSWSDEIE